MLCQFVVSKFGEMFIKKAKLQKKTKLSRKSGSTEKPEQFDWSLSNVKYRIFGRIPSKNMWRMFITEHSRRLRGGKRVPHATVLWSPWWTFGFTYTWLGYEYMLLNSIARSQIFGRSLEMAEQDTTKSMKTAALNCLCSLHCCIFFFQNKDEILYGWLTPRRLCFGIGPSKISRFDTFRTFGFLSNYQRNT